MLLWPHRPLVPMTDIPVLRRVPVGQGRRHALPCGLSVVVRLFRPAASVPATASPRSRMWFMITFGFASFLGPIRYPLPSGQLRRGAWFILNHEEIGMMQLIEVYKPT